MMRLRVGSLLAGQEMGNGHLLEMDNLHHKEVQVAQGGLGVSVALVGPLRNSLDSSRGRVSRPAPLVVRFALEHVNFLFLCGRRLIRSLYTS